MAGSKHGDKWDRMERKHKQEKGASRRPRTEDFLDQVEEDRLEAERQQKILKAMNAEMQVQS